MPSARTDHLRRLFDSIVAEAIEVARSTSFPLFTFALYHDHESAAVSVCMDTEDNSTRSVLKANAWSIKHFILAIDEGDLKKASLFQSNVGRSLSLGNFALKNVARRNLDDDVRPNNQFYLAMIKALRQREVQISRLSPSPDRLLFSTSGANDEVGYVWSFHPSA